ncbi:hypothetical protein ACHAPJ_009182 [Fusarium lateritium]
MTLNEGINMMDAKAMCIANDDKNETARAKNYNRIFAREMACQLFIKLSQDGSNGGEPVIDDEYQPDTILQSNL